MVIFFGLLVPRVVVLLLWLLTNWFQGMFATVLWPIFGFIFLPTTLLWYSVVQNWLGGDLGIVAIIGFAISFLLDLGLVARRRRVALA